jgi:hypothetical protein
MNGSADERIDARHLRNWLAGNTYPDSEAAVVVDGERAALVLFSSSYDADGYGEKAQPYALNIPVIYPPDGFLEGLLVHYIGQLHGRPEVKA